ncbi:MAG: glycosyltransferase family 2 protein [Flavobacteriales bacterium]|nr:glycosyltransferase family 2 protein [Flavobacteriales bacterium]
MRQPYLSIVVSGRNDNYGGDFRERLQNCLDWNAELFNRYGLRTEFILVNWNPVVTNEPLISELVWPEYPESVSYRVIDVPEEIHKKYVDEGIRNTVPFYEFIAKNVGIRRSAGEYVLCINADILLHPDIVKAIAQKELSKGHYYRANRLDFKKVHDLKLDVLWKSGFAVSLKGFMYGFVSGLSKPFQYHWLKKFNRFRLAWEAFKLQNDGLANLIRLNVVYNKGGYMAHCLNSGDFMLMNRSHWMQLNGYPEYTRIATHTDAIFTVIASSELEEVVFEQPVFHQEHERRYTWEAIQKQSGFLEAYELFEKVARTVAEGGPLEQFLNDENWGLANFQLKESDPFTR